MPKVKPLKRANGTGSVFKKSGRRRKPWRAVVCTGRDKEGKLIRTPLGSYKTKTEALKALSEYSVTPTERPNIKLCEVYEEWSATKYKSAISKDTIDGYKAAYLALERYYNTKFKDLRTVHYKGIVEEKKKDFSYSYLKKFKGLVMQLYDYAMENDIVTKNYGKFINNIPPEPKSNRDAFTDIQMYTLFKNDQEHFVKIIIMMCYMSYRMNVVRNLTRFNLHEFEDMYYFIGGNKTVAGMDNLVPIPQSLNKYLLYFVNLNGDVIFCNEKGKQYSEYMFRKLFKETTKRLFGSERLPHETKHTFVSMCSDVDLNEDMQLKLNGHTDKTTSQKFYTHKHLRQYKDAESTINSHVLNQIEEAKKS